MSTAQTTLTPIRSTLAAEHDLGALVALFVNEMPQRLRGLQSLHAQENWQGLARAAHQIKGAAGSYGFHELAPYAARLEAICHDAAYERAAALLDEFAEACGRLCAS